MNILLEKFNFTPDMERIISNSPSVIIPETKETLYELIFGNEYTDTIEVSYDVRGKLVKEATVVRCRNGASVNFVEDYMRRRDPDCMRIADDMPTDKPRFEEVYGYPFSDLREETYQWLSRQELILVPFKAGGYQFGYDSILVCPRNTAFFAFALAQLQAFINIRQVERLCKILADIKNSGREVVLVSSGAVAVGASKMGLQHKPQTIPEKQAAAAVGQCELCHQQL